MTEDVKVPVKEKYAGAALKALGGERAAAVMKYLADQGVQTSRMRTISYGEEKPECRDQDEGCFQRNRRAAFEMAK